MPDISRVEFRPKPCPDCGSKVPVRSNRSSYCPECYSNRYGRTECPRCGGKMRRISQLCATCANRSPVKPRKMSAAEIAWVAGIIEGEGSFAQSRPRIAVSMTDRDIIERLHRVTGIGHVIYDRPGQMSHHKPHSIWYVQRGEHALHLVSLIRPWLGIRRKSAALRMLSNCGLALPRPDSNRDTSD